METNLLELLKGELMIILIIAPFLIIGALIVVKYGRDNLRREKEQEVEYERLYNKIESYMGNDIIFYGHKEFVWAQITILKNLPYKNPEKTEVLWNNYLLKLEKVKKSINQI
jgi:hypothetical protein